MKRVFDLVDLDEAEEALCRLDKRHHCFDDTLPEINPSNLFAICGCVYFRSVDYAIESPGFLLVRCQDMAYLFPLSTLMTNTTMIEKRENYYVDGLPVTRVKHGYFTHHSRITCDPLEESMQQTRAKIWKFIDYQDSLSHEIIIGHIICHKEYPDNLLIVSIPLLIRGEYETHTFYIPVGLFNNAKHWPGQYKYCCTPFQLS